MIYINAELETGLTRDIKGYKWKEDFPEIWTEDKDGEVIGSCMYDWFYFETNDEPEMENIKEQHNNDMNNNNEDQSLADAIAVKQREDNYKGPANGRD